MSPVIALKSYGSGSAIGTHWHWILSAGSNLGQLQSLSSTVLLDSLKIFQENSLAAVLLWHESWFFYVPEGIVKESSKGNLINLVVQEVSRIVNNCQGKPYLLGGGQHWWSAQLINIDCQGGKLALGTIIIWHHWANFLLMVFLDLSDSALQLFAK